MYGLLVMTVFLLPGAVIGLLIWRHNRPVKIPEYYLTSDNEAGRGVGAIANMVFILSAESRRKHLRDLKRRDPVLHAAVLVRYRELSSRAP